MAIEAVELAHADVEGFEDFNAQLSLFRERYGDVWLPTPESQPQPESFVQVQQQVDDALPYASPGLREVLAEMWYEGPVEPVVIEPVYEGQDYKSQLEATLAAYYGTPAPAAEIVDLLDIGEIDDDMTAEAVLDDETRTYLEHYMQRMPKSLQIRYPNLANTPLERLPSPEKMPREANEAEQPVRLKDVRRGRTPYKGQPLERPSQFWPNLPPDLYKDQADELVDVGQNMLLTGDHGIGKTRILTPQLYRTAQERGYTIPYHRELLGLNMSDFYLNIFDKHEGRSDEVVHMMFRGIDPQEQRFLVLDECTYFGIGRGGNAPLASHVFNALAEYNVRVVGILPFTPNTSSAERLEIATQLAESMSGDANGFTPVEITPEPLPQEEVNEMLTAMGLDQEIIDWFGDPDNAVLRHPRLFDKFLQGMWPDELQTVVVTSLESLQKRLTMKTAAFVSGELIPTFHAFFSAKIGAHAQELAEAFKKIDIEISKEELADAVRIESGAPLRCPDAI